MIRCCANCRWASHHPSGIVCCKGERNPHRQDDVCGNWEDPLWTMQETKVDDIKCCGMTTAEKPLGRDGLGRLVYEGDRLRWDGIRHDGPWPPLHPYVDDTIRFEGYEWATYINDHCTVDLDASPSRTFYERYFADLGTIDQVEDAAFIDEQDTLEGARFWFELYWDLGIGYDFMRWLEQEAVF